MSNGTWEHVTIDEGILNGFRQCDYFDFDGSVDKLHSKLRDTIKNREVPHNFAKNLNVFIDEIKSIRDAGVHF